MEKVELKKVKIVAVVLVVVLSVQYTTANHDIPYSLGAKKTVCVPSINYTSCTHPGMKLNYHPPTSNTSVGTLLYNKLFMPDRVVARANTTEYGFSGVTSERNDSALCVCFNEMSALANGSKFSLDQICGISKLDREKTFNFEFFLVPSEGPSSSTPTTTTGNISTSSGPSEVSSAYNTPATTHGNITTSAGFPTKKTNSTDTSKKPEDFTDVLLMTPSTETQTEITKLTLGNDTNLHNNPRKTESVQVKILLTAVLSVSFIVIAVLAAVMCRRWIEIRGTATICCGPNEENLTEYLVKLETV